MIATFVSQTEERVVSDQPETKMNRAQRRANAKKQKKSKTIEDAVGMFNLLPDKCSSCESLYDKKNRKMAMSWKVVVREKEKIVRLYCPTCWNTAKQVISNNRGA